MSKFERFRKAQKLGKKRTLRDTQFDDQVYRKIGPKPKTEQNEDVETLETHENDPFELISEESADPVYKRRAKVTG